MTDRAAGAVVFRRGEHGVRLLLLRASGRWGFPRGPVEDGEPEFAAARREVWEKTGLGEIRFPFGEEHCDTLPYAGGTVVRYYLAEAETGTVEPPPAPGRAMHDAWRWASLEEAEDLLPPRLAVVLEWARRLLELDVGQTSGRAGG